MHIGSHVTISATKATATVALRALEAPCTEEDEDLLLRCVRLKRNCEMVGWNDGLLGTHSSWYTADTHQPGISASWLGHEKYLSKVGNFDRRLHSTVSQ
jgi:hypothetical protein